MKYIILFESFVGMDPFTMTRPIDEYTSRLSRTDDLWEVDKIECDLESARDVDKKDYFKFHTESIPNWVKNIGTNIKFDGLNLQKKLDDIKKEFEGYLSEKGYESRDRITTYAPVCDDSRYSNDGVFSIIFDIDNNENYGWAAFKFKIDKYSSRFYYTDTNMEKEKGEYDLSQSEVKCIIEIGNGNVGTYKVGGPYKNLLDYFSECAIVLSS